MKYLNHSDLPSSTEQISCDLWFMPAPSKPCYFHQIDDASFFLPASNELHSHCKLDHPAFHWQVRDVCVGGNLPQLKEGMGCSVLAALHAALSSLWLSSHLHLPLPLLLMSHPLWNPRQPSGFWPCVMFPAGCWSSFLPHSLSKLPLWCILRDSREQCGFSWACHKEKSKSQAMDVHFDLLHRGK